MQVLNREDGTSPPPHVTPGRSSKLSAVSKSRNTVSSTVISATDSACCRSRARAPVSPVSDIIAGK